MLSEGRDELRKNIDKEIAALFERIRCLYASRNALAPVNSLPAEVLSRIFLLIRNLSSNHGPYSMKYLDWLQITQVSQHWRQVAIEYASLWTQLPNLCNENFLQLFLARSRACPISIVMHITKNSLPPFRSALKSLFRIQNLQLVAWGHWDDIVSHLRYPALELEELEISGEQAAHPEITWPQDFLGGNAPYLRRLTITNFPFFGYLPAFRGLTVLCLQEPNPRPSLLVLLRSLHQIPNLRTLTIKDSNEQELSDDDDDDIDVPDLLLPIVLSHLDKVTIYSPVFERTLLLFRSLQFLKSPTLIFQHEGEESELMPELFSQLLEVLQEAFHTGMMPPFRMKLGASSFEFRVVTWDIEANITLDIKIFCADQGAILFDVFDGWYHQCFNLGLAHLESLELYDAGSLFFFQALDQLPQLKHLILEDEDGDGGFTEFFLENFDRHCEATKGSMALALADTCGEGDKWDDVALPALETITFFCSTYRHHQHWVQTLIARRHHGYGPKKIVFKKCDFVEAEAELVRDLRAIVEVEWDGHGF